jgi:hypothetical protein
MKTKGLSFARVQKSVEEYEKKGDSFEKRVSSSNTERVGIHPRCFRMNGKQRAYSGGIFVTVTEVE